jgi:nitrate reductase gamma subunit
MVLAYGVAVAMWGAVLVGVAGVVWRLVRWFKAPQQYPLVLTPAPTSTLGVASRLALESVAFRSLFRADKLGWLLGWSFHCALVLILIRHLWLVFDALPAWIGPIVSAGAVLTAVLALSLLGLGVRRAVHPRIRYISAPSDYLWLVLLLALVASGGWMGYVEPQRLGELRGFVNAWARFEVAALPMNGAFLVHVALASVLVVAFPFSKLMHGPGVMVSPTFTGRESARRRRNDG